LASADTPTWSKRFVCFGPIDGGNERPADPQDARASRCPFPGRACLNGVQARGVTCPARPTRPQQWGRLQQRRRRVDDEQRAVHSTQADRVDALPKRDVPHQSQRLSCLQALSRSVDAQRRNADDVPLANKSSCSPGSSAGQVQPLARRGILSASQGASTRCAGTLDQGKQDKALAERPAAVGGQHEACSARCPAQDAYERADAPDRRAGTDGGATGKEGKPLSTQGALRRAVLREPAETPGLLRAGRTARRFRTPSSRDGPAMETVVRA
jgi:hypothetical protein